MQLGLELGPLLLEIAQVAFGHVPKVRVGEQLLGVAGARLEVAVAGDGGGDGGDLGVLAREGQQAGLVLRDFGGAEHDAQLFVTLGDALELGAQGRVHGERATLAPGPVALKGHAAAAGANGSP
nr:hypothetical protein [Nannocystis pusilla]